MKFCKNYTVKDVEELPQLNESTEYDETFVYEEKTVKYIHRVHKVYLMCPKCYNIMETSITEDTKVSIETSTLPNVKITNPRYKIMIDECPYCGRKTVFPIVLDYELGEIISKLNKKGYITEYSCVGHEENVSLMYLAFKDNTISRFLTFLPDPWEIDLDVFRRGKCIISVPFPYIRAYFDDNLKIYDSYRYACDKKEALDALRIFVDALPNVDIIP